MTAANPVLASETVGAWDQFVTHFNEVISWTGRQLSAMGNAIADYATKAYDYAKPFFEKIGQFFVEMYEKLSELIVQHKTESMAIAATAIVGVIVTIVAMKLCGVEKGNEAQGASS